jgi:hypothetical protein
MYLAILVVCYEQQMGKITAATMLETAETELAAKLGAPMSQAVFMNVLHCVSDRYMITEHLEQTLVAYDRMLYVLHAPMMHAV